MKKCLVPLLLFAAVFVVSWQCQPFTLICQEYEGLFLNTPDAWARAFSQPWPLSGVASDFLIQFYRDPLYGALITAALVVLAFLLGRATLRRVGLPWDLIPTLGAGALWFFLSRADGPKVAVAVVLVLLGLWLLSMLLFSREKAPWRTWDAVLSAVLVLAASALVVFDPVVQRNERFARVKRDALYGVWDDLLKTVPPEVAREDPELTPFALLALSGKGELNARMDSYPVYDENDLDMVYYDGNKEYYTSLLFKACLYQYLGCYNEAIHNYYQWATQLRHGTGFVVLRRMVELYYLQGNYTLMEKYCRILERSSANGAYVRHFRTQASLASAAASAASGSSAAFGTPQASSATSGSSADLGTPQASASDASADLGTPQVAAEAPAVRAAIPVISHDPLYNLILLEKNGFHSPMLEQRLPATLMLRGAFASPDTP